jgi:hypothetical protein
MIKINRELVNSKKSVIVVFYLAVTIMLIITGYGIFISAENYKNNKKIIIGDVLLDTEFPFKGSVNLVTYLMIFSLVSWFTAMKIFEDNIINLSSYIQTILQICSLVAIVISVYELFYNVTVWNSIIIDNLISGNFDPDKELINYPKPDTPWNLAFATQMFLASLIITSHCFYIITKSKNT